MRRYEVVFVLAPTLSEEEVQAQIDTFSEVAKDKGANLVNVDLWGKRRLAFPVKKFTDGLYVVMRLEEGAAEAVRELERRFKVTDAVIRFLTIRVDQALKREEKFHKKREARKAKRKAAAAREPAAAAAAAEQE